MKLRLPNKLVAAIMATASPVLFTTLSTATIGSAAVAVVAQTASADSVLQNATLSIDSFDSETIKNLNSNGWNLANISEDESSSGVYTSTANKGVITSTNGTNLATRVGTSNRYVWSAVFTVEASDIKNATNLTRLLMGVNEGIGVQNDTVFGAYTNGTWYGSFKKSDLVDNGNGTYTFGVSYLGNNGTSIFSSGVQANNSDLKDGTNAGSIYLADRAGISYTNLYWFNNVLTDADMRWAVQEAGSNKIYTWNGTSENSAWNTTDRVWLENGQSTTFVASDATSGLKNSVIFDDTATGKTVEIGEDLTMAGGVKIEASGYTFNITNNAVVSFGAIVEKDGVTGTRFNVEAGSRVIGNSGTMTYFSGGGDMQLSDTCTFAGGQSSHLTGTLFLNNLDNNEIVRVGTHDSQMNSLASFSKVQLDNGSLLYQNKKDTLNNVTVNAEKTGKISSIDMGGNNIENAASLGDISDTDKLHLAGTTTVNGNLTINNWWNALFAIDELVGSGTLKLTGMTDENNPADKNSSAQDAAYIISSLSDETSAFSGTLTVDSDKISAVVHSGAKDVALSALNITKTNANGIVLDAQSALTLGSVTVGSGATLKLSSSGDDGAVVINKAISNTGTLSVQDNTKLNVLLPETMSDVVARERSEGNGFGSATHRSDAIVSGAGSLNLGNNLQWSLNGNDAEYDTTSRTAYYTGDSSIYYIYDKNEAWDIRNAGEVVVDLNGVSNKVTFDSAHTYAGGTTINNSTLVVQDAHALGTGSVTITNGGLLDLAKASTGFSLQGISDITLQDEGSGVLVRLDTGIGAQGANVAMNMGDGTYLELRNGGGGISAVYADITTNGNVQIKGPTNGNNANLNGTITGTGSLSVVSGSNDLNINSVLSGAFGLTLNNSHIVTLNGDNRVYSGDINVQSGTLKLGHINALGALNSAAGQTRRITIGSGAKLDLNGKYGNANSGYHIILNGGTLTNSTGSIALNNAQLITGITLDADSKVEALSDRDYGMVRYNYANSVINLGDHILEKTGAGTFYLTNTTINGTGSIKVSEGTFKFELQNSNTENGAPRKASAGNMTLAAGANITAFYRGYAAKGTAYDTYKADIGHLTLQTTEQNKTATVEATNFGGLFEIGALTSKSDAILTLQNSASSNVHTTFSIGGSASTAEATEFHGTLDVKQTNGGANRGTIVVFNDEYTAADAELQISAVETIISGGTRNNRVLGIGLNSTTVKLKGISDGDIGTAGANSQYQIFSGSGSNLDNLYDGGADYFSNAADGTVRTLELTGNGTYSTSAEVGSNINLAMSGTGTQEFSGNVNAFNGTLAVADGGKLSFTGLSSDTTNNLHISSATVSATEGDSGALQAGAATLTAQELTEGSLTNATFTADSLTGKLDGSTDNGTLVNALLTLQESTTYSISDMDLQNSYINAEAATKLALQNINVNGVSGVSAVAGSTLSGQNYLTLSDASTEIVPNTNITTDQLSGLTLQSADGNSLSLTLKHNPVSDTLTNGAGFSITLSDFKWQDLIGEGGTVQEFAITDQGRLNEVFKVTALGSGAPTSIRVVNAQMVGQNLQLDVVPEPTTGALSLLALTALAARRRRK